MNPTKNPWGLELFVGLIWIGLGSLTLFLPFFSTFSAVFIFGLILVGAGLVQCFSVLFDWKEYSFTRFLLGVLTLIFGLALLSNMFAGMITITMLIVIMFLMQGAIMVLASLLEKKTDWLLLISGVISLIAAFMIVGNLIVSSVFLVGLLLGIQMIIYGFGLVVEATFMDGNAPTGRKVLGTVLIILMTLFVVLPALFKPAPVRIMEDVLSETETTLIRYNPAGTTWAYDGGTLSFEDGAYTMDFGCNVMSGTYSVERAWLSFTEPVSTRKACPADIAAKETAFSHMITKAHVFDGGSETLSGDGVMMELTAHSAEIN